ncbi:MAG: hypothetical protein LBH51_00550 [Treponema sp.]|jgi:hypothetical protein|nr:hypothetical protein [Treponema sp.]
MWIEEIYHEGEEGARRRGLKALFHSFVFLCAPSWLKFLFPVLSLPSALVQARDEEFVRPAAQIPKTLIAAKLLKEDPR